MKKIIVSLAKISSKSDYKLNNFVASIAQYPYDINIESLIKTSEILKKHTFYFNKSNFIIINFVPFGDEKCIIDKDHIKYYEYNLFRLYKDILFGFNFLHRSEPDSLRITNKNLYYKKERDRYKIGSVADLFIKDNMSYNNVIFIFNGITWNNLVKILRSLNISIYGGNSSRRHLLSTVQSNLVKFLLLLNKLEIDPDLLYSNFIKFKKTSVSLDKKILSLEDLIFNKKNGYTEDDDKNIVEINLLTKLVLDLSYIFKETNNIRAKIFNLVKNLSDFTLRKEKKTELYLKYGTAHFNKKLTNASKNLEDCKNDLKKEISNLKLKHIEIKEKILKLYIFNDDMFFTSEGYFIYNSNIRVFLSDNDSLPNDVIIKESDDMENILNKVKYLQTNDSH